MTQLTDKAILVDVPEGAKMFYISEYFNMLSYYVTNRIYRKNLPPGPWSILSLLDEMTEEKWQEVVGKFHDNDGWPGYYNYLDERKTLFNTATESGLSLLSSKGVTDFKNKLLLVKK